MRTITMQWSVRRIHLYNIPETIFILTKKITILVGVWKKKKYELNYLISILVISYIIIQITDI